MTVEHRVKQGECLSSIASLYGLSSWKKIYEDPANEEFRRARPNPNVIRPGDRIAIPNKILKQHDGAAGKRHRFKRQGSTTLRIRLLDEAGGVLEGCPYLLDTGRTTHEGKLDGGGLLEQTIAADLASATLIIWPEPLARDRDEGIMFALQVGKLDPVEELSGVQARLTNLGFDSGPIDGRIGPITRAAIRRFQERSGLEQTGEPDEHARELLELWHDRAELPEWEETNSSPGREG